MLITIGYKLKNEKELFNQKNLKLIEYISFNGELIYGNEKDNLIYYYIKNNLDDYFCFNYILLINNEFYFLKKYSEIHNIINNKININEYKENNYLVPFEVIDLNKDIKYNCFSKKRNNKLILIRIEKNKKGLLQGELYCSSCDKYFMIDLNANKEEIINCLFCNNKIKVKTKDFNIIK